MDDEQTEEPGHDEQSGDSPLIDEDLSPIETALAQGNRTLMELADHVHTAFETMFLMLHESADERASILRRLQRIDERGVVFEGLLLVIIVLILASTLQRLAIINQSFYYMAVLLAGGAASVILLRRHPRDGG